jgi:hypothetical protein
MHIGSMLGDAYAFTKETFVGHWTRWLILLIGSIVFPILLGYTLLVYRGGWEPPDPADWVTVFIDGIKLFVVQLVYAIPVIIISFVLNIALIVPFSVMGGPGETGSTMTGAAVGATLLVVLVQVVLSILVSLISLIAAIRFARTDSFGEAFNISAILDHVGRIGWGSYILALIALYVAIFLFVIVMMVVGIITLGIGFLLFFVLAPALSIFVARYVTLIYDSAPVA